MKIRQINNPLYRIKGTLNGSVETVEAVSVEDLIDYVMARYVRYGTPVSVCEILSDGKTPKVSIYTHPYYKKRVKELNL